MPGDFSVNFWAKISPDNQNGRIVDYDGGDCNLVDCKGIHFSDILCETEFESDQIIDTLINSAFMFLKEKFPAITFSTLFLGFIFK